MLRSQRCDERSHRERHLSFEPPPGQGDRLSLSSTSGRSTGLSTTPDGRGVRKNRSRVNEILIVEDDRDFLADLLTSWHPPCPTVTASSGREACAYLESTVPALVILDLTLPHHLADCDALEGFGILSFIRASVDTDLPVIVLSRETSLAAKSRAKELGANAFVEKPLDISEIDRLVAQFIQQDDPGR
jgi:CheY-like chemotaxis protein